MYIKSPQELEEYFKDKEFWEYFLMVAEFEPINNLDKISDEKVWYKSEEIEGLEIVVKKTAYKKCERCWQRKPEVGSLEIPNICLRCFEVIKASKMEI